MNYLGHVIKIVMSKNHSETPFLSAFYYTRTPGLAGIKDGYKTGSSSTTHSLAVPPPPFFYESILPEVHNSLSFNLSFGYQYISHPMKKLFDLFWLKTHKNCPNNNHQCPKELRPRKFLPQENNSKNDNQKET